MAYLLQLNNFYFQIETIRDLKNKIKKNKIKNLVNARAWNVK